MNRRLGLRAKMSASYVLVTAAAVAVLEAVALAFAVPLLEPSRDPVIPTVMPAAEAYATRVVDANARLGRLPAAEEIQLGEPGLALGPGEAELADDGRGVRVPFVPTAQNDTRPMSLALLLDPDLRILASSYPARYPAGKRVGEPGVGPLPVDALTGSLPPPQKPASGQTRISNGEVLWAMVPVTAAPRVADPKEIAKSAVAIDPLGAVYVQAPATAELLNAAVTVDAGSSQETDVAPLLGVGFLVLLVALPVGVVFGLLATRQLIRRLRRLAASTVAVADGQYHHRVPVSGSDEIAQLERGFNRMAEQLSDAMVAERHLASATERARIARELHDSISQDLFSLRLLAGGLRRALPSESPLHSQVDAMERTATGTMHEMQALLLELRPVALRDAGLIPTLNELCQTYRDRLDVVVDADLQPVDLDPAAEHAVLRVVQEALANAVKHARSTRIIVRTRRDGDRVTVEVTDDGSGFDPARAGERHGMGLGVMRERVAELGGTLELESTPGNGTSVRVVLP